MGLSVETGEDLALSLPVGTADTEGEASKVSKRLLVNLRPHAGGLSERFAAALSERAAGLELVGVALSEEDERLMNRFAMEGRLALSRVERLWGAADAARVFREGMAAGMRLHFVILAAMAGLPLVAVPYDPKVEGFAVSHNVPLWREGPMPEARSARFPGGFSALGVRGEIDALCRKILRQT
jgi:polysaccharide pyruvyl transferase WcaK-like protein